MEFQTVIVVEDSSQVGAARRAATRLAQEIGLSEPDGGRVSIVATELANNLHIHARGGRLFLQAVRTADGVAAELLAVDSGPGMANVDRCLEDGYSTRGTPGTGLGATKRLSDEFDVFSAPNRGTVVLARVGRPAGPWGGISIPIRGEERCGDAWRFESTAGRFSLLIADGLGHGPLAADASGVAVKCFGETKELGPKGFIESAHRAMSGTRGAAVAAASFDGGSRTLRYAGVGNISGTLLTPSESRGLFSHNGTVGVNVRKVQQFDYPCPDRALLIMHSDGIQTRWSLDPYPGLFQRHPAVVAAVLLRDFCRGRDDATAVAVRLTYPEE